LIPINSTPIAVFAFARPRHLDLALRSLARCTRLAECSVHIYCDGPRRPADVAAVRSTRQVARAWAARLQGEVIEEPTNIGLAKSISMNVTRLCEQYGQVIVVEDDLYVSPDFLEFMLLGLDTYRNDPAVFQVGGFMYPIPELSRDRALLLPYTSSWGWATWQRAWAQYDYSVRGWREVLAAPAERERFDLGGSYPFSRTLEQQVSGLDSTWDIQWYFTVFKAHGLSLYPPLSLVRNGGIFGAATHCGVVDHSPEPVEAFDRPRLSRPYMFPASAEVDPAALELVQQYLKRVRRLEAPTLGNIIRHAPLHIGHRALEALRCRRR
jgi:hypothetical protein